MKKKGVHWPYWLAAALLVCLGAMQYQAIDIKKDCEVTGPVDTRCGWVREYPGSDGRPV